MRPALLIANSRFSAESARRLFPEVPLQVIYCPVKNSARQLAPVARAALRSSLSTSPSDTVIIQVSRIEAGKGHRLQLEALHLLKDRPGWQCWIVGGAQRKEEKEYEVALREFARDLGISKRLHFLGERADVPNLLAAADVFAQPNVSGEGFGIVFIEALQAGLPIVATAIGATYEVLDESCSLIVPPEPIALAEAYVRLLADKDLRSRLGRNGPARAYAISDPAHRLAEINAALMSASRDGLPGTPLLK